MAIYQKEKSKNLQHSAEKWAGKSLEKPIQYTGKWHTLFNGKLSKLRFVADKSGKVVTCMDWSKERATKTFYLKDYDFKNYKPPKPQKPKDNLTEEFNKLPPANPKHPYILKKNVDISNLYIKQEKSNIVVPVFSQKNTIISFQYIYPSGKKMFKTDYELGKGFYFPIGDPSSEKIYVCEGIATGASIYKITNSRVYCSFSVGNLDNVVDFVLKKYQDKEIVLALDNDGPEKTHNTTIKDKRVSVVYPETKGDFNDCQTNEKEQDKLKLIDMLTNPIKDPIYKTDYLDINNLFLRRYLGVVAGAKASMKSRGTLSYLLDQGIRIGYFSDNENTPAQIRAIVKAKEAQEKQKDSFLKKEFYLRWMNMENPNFLKRISDIVRAKKLDVIFEDPPFENAEFSNMQGLRKQLGLRAKLANQLNIGWIVTRNLAKADYAEYLNKVSGFGVWTNLPRYTIGVFPIEIGHEQRIKMPEVKHQADLGNRFNEQGTPKKSLMQSLVVNEGPTPTQSIILTLEKQRIDSDEQKKAIDIAICKTEKIDRVQKPDIWCKAPASNATNEFKALYALDKTGTSGMKSKDFANTLIEELKIGIATANRLIAKMKKTGVIEGGGSGKKSPIVITESGKAILNKDFKD